MLSYTPYYMVKENIVRFFNKLFIFTANKLFNFKNIIA